MNQLKVGVVATFLILAAAFVAASINTLIAYANSETIGISKVSPRDESLFQLSMIYLACAAFFIILAYIAARRR